MKSSSSSGIISDFCLGSQPSGIPLILHGLPLDFQAIEAPSIIFHYYLYFSLMLGFFFFNFFLIFFLCFSLPFVVVVVVLPPFFYSLIFFPPDMAIREVSVASTSYHTPQHIPP